MTKPQNGWPEHFELLQGLRCVHVRHLLRALPRLPQRRGPQQVRAPLLLPRLLLPLRACSSVARRGQGQIQHRG